MTEPMAAKWDARYTDARVEDNKACRALIENTHLLPQQGIALDVACGLGANAVCLAEHNLQVNAWDLSPVAVKKVQQYAARNSLSIECEVKDVIQNPPSADQYDVIVVAYFLWRPLFAHLLAALKPSGLFFIKLLLKIRWMI